MFKKRTKYGEFVDEHLGYGGQERIKEKTGLNRDTVSKACNELDYTPSRGIQNLLVSAAKELTGEKIEAKNFW